MTEVYKETEVCSQGYLQLWRTITAVPTDPDIKNLSGPEKKMQNKMQ